MSTLAIAGLHVRHGKTEAVRGVDLMCETGQITALIGANGAGKTTLLRAVSGLVATSQGTVSLDGSVITGHSPHLIARAGIGHVQEGRGIWPTLTVDEHLRLGGWGVDPATARDRRAEVLQRLPRLAERLEQRAGSLSGGEQQMVAIGRALMAGPRVLLLDEPSMGLAPLIEDAIFRMLASLREQGATLLLVEQNASAALDIADAAYVLEGGRITLHGPAAMVARDPAVLRAYLGGV